MKNLCLIILSTIFLSGLGQAGDNHPCRKDALLRAEKLLSFFSGNDDRMEIDRQIKVLPSIRNPANRRQRLDVIEVWGFIYKAEYRMHFLYGRISGCVLMGEEILEYSSL
jgi:hypothetical protein